MIAYPLVRLLLVAAVAVVCGALAAPCFAGFIVDETFGDGDRTIQNPPSSLQWTYGANHADSEKAYTLLDASSGQLLWNHTPFTMNFAAVWGFFAPPESPLTLAVGDSLRLSFSVHLIDRTTLSNSAFRWGLFDSANSRTTSDFAGTSESGIANGQTFAQWRGYDAETSNLGSTGNGPDFLVRERTGSGSGLFTSDNWSAFQDSAVVYNYVDLPEEVDYSVSLELMRSAWGVSLQGAVNGVKTNLVVDQTNPLISFDTIAFFAHNNTPDLTLDNIRLEITTVPEPSTILLLLVAFIIIGVRMDWAKTSARRDVARRALSSQTL